ncbi:phage tail assembly chaperone G [Bacillus paramycoides]|uniref:phage tail assembly chaperone G n=1 Tax=Bacillus paramycoides TaxID=2026194 RepID=UPI003CFF5D72
MKLALIIDGEKQTFNMPEFIPARLIRQAPELADIPNNPGPEDMDKMVQYVVKVYGNQFTLDQYWDGVDARKFLSTTTDVINAIINETVEAASGTTGTGEEENPNA